MDSTLLFAAMASAASFMMSRRIRRTTDTRGRQTGSKMRRRVRRSVESVCQEIWDVLLRRAYRMTYTSFHELHRLLEPELLMIHKEYQDDATARRRRRRLTTCSIPDKSWKRFVPNGKIASTVRVTVALLTFSNYSLPKCFRGIQGCLQLFSFTAKDSCRVCIRNVCPEVGNIA
jgi:hypothetical protein